MKDKNGNLIEIYNGQVTILLKNATRKSKRVIGNFDFSDNYIKSKLRADVHKFRANEGWGINWDVVNIMDPEKKVIIETDIGTFSITKREILEQKDNIVMFSRQGFECQYIVPERLMKKER